MAWKRLEILFYAAIALHNCCFDDDQELPEYKLLCDVKIYVNKLLLADKKYIV